MTSKGGKNATTDTAAPEADALRRALNDLDTYAAGGPADLTKELRALLGLPRKT